MSTLRFIFHMTGDPADSPDSPCIDVYRKLVQGGDYEGLVAAVEALADKWTPRTQYGCETVLDVASLRASFVADALRALANFDAASDRGRVFSAESIDESCWRTRVRIYHEDEDGSH